MSIESVVIEKLRKILGPGHLVTDPSLAPVYGYDATNQSFPPDAVAFPGNEHDVARVLRLCNEHGILVTPRGAGTGMTGGSLPVRGGLVMVLSRLNRILAIDADNLVAVVEPGVVTGDFHKAVEAEGLFYPPDPSSSQYSTMGGNAAECAGGPRAVKYGVTRDYILGLTAVLADGNIIKTGVRTAKGVAGYDMTRLLVGSEGTLAVITRITVRLLPLPPVQKTLTAVFDEIEDAARTVSALFREKVVCRGIEYLDRAAIACAEEYLNLGLPRDAGALLLLEVDGDEASAGRDAEAARRVCLAQGAREVTGEDDPERAQNLWKARKALSPALYKYAPHKINEDIVVPRNKIPRMVRAVDELREKTGLTMVTFGHAGDGNMHVNVMLDRSDPEMNRKAEAAIDEIFDLTLKLGGTITGEHGVGITKMDFLSREIGPVEQNLMKGVKNLFDPKGILNPGKIFQ